MEEVDGIIIESLKGIHCEIEETITSLKEFTSEMVFNSIVCCLETINPHTKFPHKIPSSMSVRLKVATSIAEQIKELNYRGDMGYQTILYYNENEIRRVLMFLVERLPRETHKTAATEDLGYVSKVIKELEEQINLSFNKFWVPSSYLKQGIRECDNINLKQDFSHSFPLKTQPIYIPNLQETPSEAVKQYWVHNLPDVVHQCDSKNLIPSLLFKDCDFSTATFQHGLTNGINEDIGIEKITASVVSSDIKLSTDKGLGHDSSKQDLELIKQELITEKSKYDQLKSKYETLKENLTQLKEEKDKRETTIKDIVVKGKTKTKALAVISNQENLNKLKLLIENGKKRLLELSNQWQQVQTPLLEHLKTLEENSSTRESEELSAQQKLQNLKEKNQQMLIELQEKEKLESKLVKEFEKVYKNTHRSAYTRRILEIIANIKKQNEEIQKVLKETKLIQKDINNLNGQLDRSFTLSDEVIFQDAKRDEMARKAYKFLATLHSDCGEVIQAVTDLGLVERECRNLQEQVDAEIARETSSKLNQVNADLTEIKKETAILTKKLRNE